MSDASFEQAKQQFITGLACFEAGRYTQADQHFEASLALLPGRVSTLVNLAATRLKLERPQAALEAADQVLAIEPDNADAWLHRANSLLGLNRHEQALPAFDRLLSLQPGFAPGWCARGDILRELGRAHEAEQSYRQALAHGGDAELIGYYLASLGGERSAPGVAPRAYVEALFDGYATQFAQHVVQVLNYRAHEVLTRPLATLHPERFASVLDLGCGTGLCGPLVKPRADRLVGVDLSAQMIEQARALGVYDHLVHADITEHLRHANERHDLVLAADVFIYIGDLAPIFEAVGEVVSAGSLFCFSTEVAGPETRGFELLPSLRYAHAESYLRGLAGQHGFEVVKLSRELIREDQRRAIDGVFVYLVRR
jgi:predicted TPR repeat methyltransferase